MEWPTNGHIGGKSKENLIMFSLFTMKRVALVTSGAGFIGSHLVDGLLNEGWHVRVIDNFSIGRWENLKHLNDNPHFKLIAGDLKTLMNA